MATLAEHWRTPDMPMEPAGRVELDEEPLCRDCVHCVGADRVGDGRGGLIEVAWCDACESILDWGELHESMRARSRTCACDPETDVRP